MSGVGCTLQSVHGAAQRRLSWESPRAADLPVARSLHRNPGRSSYPRLVQSGRLHRLATARERGGARVCRREDLLDDRLRQDRRDGLRLVAAVRAVLQVELEYTLEQPGPAQLYWTMVCTVRLAFGRFATCADGYGSCDTTKACSLSLAHRMRKAAARTDPTRYN